jgi:galactokinase
VLADRRRLVELLAAKGLSAQASQEKADLFVKAAAALWQAAGPRADAGVAAYFVPGRIEVLGKHTDYAGGHSMLVAAERGFCATVRPRDDNRVHVIDAVAQQRVEFLLHPDLAPTAGHWSNYPMTVARRIARNFPGACRGAEIAFGSDLPPAAGMSSSSAMIVAVFLALAEVNQLASRAEYRENLGKLTALAGYLGTIENGQNFGPLTGDRGVGTFGGSEDHTAILCALPNRVCEYAFCPVKFQRAVRVPPGCTFAIGVSGVVAEKTGAAREKYNTASRLVTALEDLWRRETGRADAKLAAMLASSPDAAARLRAIVAGTPQQEFATSALLARLGHFAAENGEIIPAAGSALERGDVAGFGRLVDQSERGAEELLGNQVPETIYLAASARRCGALAASAFGAGFGGSVWALIRTSEADAFLTAWADAYRNQFPQHAAACDFFTTAAGPPAFRVQ